MFSKIIKLITATVVSFGLMGAAPALASSGSIYGPTGPHSNNQVINNSFRVVTVTKVANVGVANLNFQGASSGSAFAFGNTVVGGVNTGSAGNSNNTTTTIVVSQ